MPWKVLKIPCPNSQQFVARIPGNVIDVLHFQAQVMRHGAVLGADGKGKANMMLAVWFLVDDTGQEEDHQFILVQTGADIPAVDAEIRHIGTTAILMPDGNNIEFNLFYAGETFEYSDQDIPTQEEAPHGKH